jgi:hypothetical protein
LGATARSVQRTTHILWLEVTGLFFLLFALVCGGEGWREYRLHQASILPARSHFSLHGSPSHLSGGRAEDNPCRLTDFVFILS